MGGYSYAFGIKAIVAAYHLGCTEQKFYKDADKDG